MDVRSRRGREVSPDRAKVCMQPKVKTIRKVQVVYYLTRNGQLEHPHYMEVTHLANHPLRLKDVMDRLTILRGKGMPSLYSWSCKRSYKNGYVWNDLAENDVIYPSDGAEYVLKGSELVDGCSEKFQQLHVSSCGRQLTQLHQEPNFLHSKRKIQTGLPPPNDLHKEQPPAEEPDKSTMYEDQHYQEEEEEEYEEDEEKSTSYTSSTTPHSRCSRGVSTDELDDQEPPPKTLTEPTATHHNSPPPVAPTSLSSILSNENTTTKSNNASKRFEDGDPIATMSAPSRNSVLLQLISCGNLTAAKPKNVPSFRQTASDNAVKRCSSDLHRGVLYKRALKVAEEEDMISYMSENPRFGNLQAEEKEYFSGSIVESVSKDRVETQPILKRSNSYNEERSCKAGMEVAAKEDEEERRKSHGLKGKCIPRKKSSSSSKKMIRK